MWDGKEGVHHADPHIERRGKDRDERKDGKSLAREKARRGESGVFQFVHVNRIPPKTFYPSLALSRLVPFKLSYVQKEISESSEKEPRFGPRLIVPPRIIPKRYTYICPLHVFAFLESFYLRGLVSSSQKAGSGLEKFSKFYLFIPQKYVQFPSGRYFFFFTLIYPDALLHFLTSFLSTIWYLCHWGNEMNFSTKIVSLLWNDMTYRVS